jgi:two-component system sensor histidine kinase QseC
MFLVVVLLATMTLVVFIATLRGYRSSMLRAEIIFDRQLDEIARLLDGMPPDSSAAVIVRGGDNLAFQIWDGEVLLRRSVNTPETAIARRQPGYLDSNFSGHRWRTLVRAGHGDHRWIMVANRIDARFQLADDVIMKAVLPIIFVIPLAGFLIWFIVGRGLKPLRDLAAQLSAKRSDDLSAIPGDEMPGELAQVIHSTNELLGRLAASFDREKRFAADAAHELRTPISVLKIDLHNLAQDLPANNPNLNRLKDGVERMNRLVEQILALYRTTPDQFMANFTQLDMNVLAQDVISQCYSEFDAKGQQVELTGVISQMVGDRFALETLLQNLLSNACKYTPHGGRVMVTVQPENDGVLLQVEDSGPGIPADEHERVFERFYRTGGDRHASGEPGCGLGLAIVKHIADLHSARLTLGSSSIDNGLAVRVFFPSSPTTGSDVS